MGKSLGSLRLNVFGRSRELDGGRGGILKRGAARESDDFRFARPRRFAAPVDDANNLRALQTSASKRGESLFKLFLFKSENLRRLRVVTGRKSRGTNRVVRRRGGRDESVVILRDGDGLLRDLILPIEGRRVPRDFGARRRRWNRDLREGRVRFGKSRRGGGSRKIIV